MPQFHPGDEDLLDYAVGRLAEPFAVAIAIHLTFCPACRRVVAALEGLGGAAVEAAPASEMSAGSLDRLLARLDEPEPAAPVPPPATGELRHLPAPLRAFLDGAPVWKRVMRGLEDAELGRRQGRMRVRLMRAAPGVAMPRHTHEGREMLVVLDGGYQDEIGDYGIGDIAVADGTLVHTPVADPVEGCLCFNVTDAPVKLTGPFGWLLNLFVRY